MKAAFRFSFGTALLFIMLLSGCVEERQISFQGLENQVRDILSVSGFEHVYRDIVYIGKKESVIGIPVVDKRLLFAIDIRVVAGIDASDGFFITSVFPDKVIVTLPPPKIILADADESTIHQFFVRERGGKIERLEFYEEINKSKEKIIEDAVSRGILLKAEGNIKKLITELLSASGIKEIRFEKGTEKKG